ncbi:endoplasmic reticulum-Golgi intermediate compartment protein 2 [Cryptococcus neoformans var. grubii H99]|uniref:Endoplasmic reticulum-Golgi intermediate compartment protein 2 n=1 Tax=Cryptococcus neoformans (strain H99 / ATCC 208821 / CBS 10515 / FGSC 9487) TaxID=235443 RepID=J9VJR6_CRYN9|nr:endoplasmic reticulum-Golgi intermediate compartment protein 2 [Cryptococcus neoformans var. grubii H99]AFR94458.1 endoplasmic reticulum-Golgi intermediate compartment protein 2 [Cryptococcus neoformans var. grubii H99]AUB24119.1 endoplasmic reticulum-Golgi intermediate compartment protein 2 [Cryptococcus neoformans var. grubii]|eukprot:XP_012048774.1 endoplasmic reticulum-Golgi intermediate compartment protein 2 [Cryptococcus neoformans var. grubii H99]
MYEPHLVDFANQHSHDNEGMSLLEELDKIAPIKSFDAFPKVESTYTIKSRRGGVLTAVVGLIIFLLVLNDLGEYLYGAPDYAFQVDSDIQKDLQLNVDLTVAMPCRYLTIDLRDAVGDRLHLSNSFAKDGTHFNVGKATCIKNSRSTAIPSASEIISSSRRRTPNQQSSFSGIKRLFGFSSSSSSNRRTGQGHTAYRPTYDKVEDGPACRIYGSVEVKKVTANLHITTLGHGYMSFQHTDHHLMNLSHVVHEFSFGPFFPAIAQPLDQSYEITEQPFTIFQYFLRVVPTTYIDASRRKLITSQYAVTDYSRSFEHGKGVPGLFFKYDLEPMSVVIRERTTSLYQFLIRLAGVVGGVWTVAAFALRVFNRAQREVSKAVVGEKEYIPSSLHTPSPAIKQEQSGYFGNDPSSTLVSRATSWVSGNSPGGRRSG